jgi:hypothetical protein
MLKRIVCLVILIIVIFICGCKSSKDDPEITGKLSIIEGISVLHLWGTPYEQGFAQGYLLAETIVAFYNQRTIDFGGIEFVNTWNNVVLPNLHLITIPQDYANELRGILEGMESKLDGPVYIDNFGRNLTYGDLVAVQSNEDILKMQKQCSSLSVWGVMTQDGHTLTGRNYDYPNVKSETDYRIIVVRPALESGELAWVSFCLPTEIGCTTGINEEGVTICQHDGVANNDFIYLYTSDTIYPDGLVHRRAIETARAGSAPADVESILRTWPVASSCIPMVTWPFTDNGPASVVFEFDGNRTIDGGVTLREVEDNLPYQISNNYFLNRPTEFTPDYRYDLVDSYLAPIAKSEGSQHVSKEFIWQLLGETPSNPSVNYASIVYAVLFEPNKMLMHIAVSQNGQQAPFCKKVSFDIAQLLAGLNQPKTS